MDTYDLKEEQVKSMVETFRGKFESAIEHDRYITAETGTAEKGTAEKGTVETGTAEKGTVEHETDAGDFKLAVYNDRLYVQPYFPLQCVSRWFNAQSRALVYSFVDEEAIEFIQFLEKFVFTLEVRKVDAGLKCSVHAFVGDFMSALRRLKEVYPSYTELNTLLDNVVGIIHIYNSILERY